MKKTTFAEEEVIEIIERVIDRLSHAQVDFEKEADKLPIDADLYDKKFYMGMAQGMNVAISYCNEKICDIKSGILESLH